VVLIQKITQPGCIVCTWIGDCMRASEPCKQLSISPQLGYPSIPTRIDAVRTNERAKRHHAFCSVNCMASGRGLRKRRSVPPYIYAPC